ncbi:transcription factor 7-like [Gouania willdenowi]|uniref:transcription factor 7-like n=1 Tax=Gouania willdenowi TaxID=441366 RepID=UPI001054EC45|nr:transcription factor 7-like [Gouania willdenowi]
MKKIIILKWKGKHFKRLHHQGSEEGLQDVTNPPLPSHPAVQQPTSTESLEDVVFVDEQMCAWKKPEYVQPEQVPYDEHRYRAQQHGGQYGGHCKSGPTVFNDVRYGAPNIEDHTVNTVLQKAEYYPQQNPGPSTIPSIPAVVHHVELPTFTPPPNAMPPGTYRDPTFGKENVNVSHPPLQSAPPVMAPVSRNEVIVTKEPYIKKPPNAFMLFLKQNRAAAEAELGVRTSAVVNKHLGERWRALSPELKGLYNAEATLHAFIHLSKNPGWTNKINYRNKRKRRDEAN